MNSNRTRRIAIIIVCCLVTAIIPTPSHAQATVAQTTIINGESDNLTFLTNEMLGAQRNSVRSDTAEATSIDYQYTYSIDQTRKYMDISLVLENELGQSITVNGVAGIYKDNNDREYAEGPLSGEITSGDQKYIVNVGFQKYLDDDKIQCSVVVQSDDCSEPLIVCHFGDTVLTSDNIDVTISDIEHRQFAFANETELNRLNDLEFEKIGADKYAYFSSSAYSGYAQRVSVYGVVETGRYAICLNSYSDNVNDYYADIAGYLDTYSTAVKEFSIDISRDNNGASARTYIAGLESEVPSDVDGYNSLNNTAKLFYKIFLWALENLEIPGVVLDIFDSIFGGAVGTGANAQLNTEERSNCVNVTANAGSSAFHMDDYYAPIVVQMASNTSGTDSYTISTDIRYVTTYMEVSGNLVYYYTTARTATKTIDVSF